MKIMYYLSLLLFWRYELENFEIRNIKRVDYRWWNITRNDAMNKTNNSKLDDKGTLWMWTLVQMERTWRVKEYWWNYYCSDYDDVHFNKYKVKYRTSLKLWENKGWINSIDPYIWFQWCFKYWIDRRYLDDKRQISRWKRIVSRFKSQLVKMIKDLMIISLKIGESLLHWGYGLFESDFFLFILLLK